MNAALWLLVKLRTKAALRKIWRTVQRPKGLLLVLFSVAFFIAMILPNLLLRRPDVPQMHGAWFLRPTALFFFWLMLTATGRNASAIAFTLPEVEFLFPGPFSRRALLTYKLGLSVLAPLGTALFLPLFLSQFRLWWPAAMLAVWLVFVFMQNTALLINLLVDWLGERWRRWRNALGAALAVVVVISAWQGGALVPGLSPLARGQALEGSWAAQVVLAPFGVFSSLAQAENAGQLALSTGLALVINAVVLALIYWMDANFIEASLQASQKRYEWMERLRRGGGFPTIGARSKPRFSLPTFPRLGGVGTIAWRQALELLRNSTRLIFILPMVVGLAVPAMITGEEFTVGPVLGMTFFVSFIISTIMPMGLRTDLAHVDAFKSLPLAAPAIVAGSLLPGVIYPLIVQLVLLAMVAVITGSWSLALTAVMIFALPLDVLLVAADSVLVLLFPSTRQFTPGDMLAGMRMTFVYLAKIALLLVAAAGAALVAGAVYLLVGEVEILMGAAAWLTLMFEGAALVILAAWLFERFDPSLDNSEPQ